MPSRTFAFFSQPTTLTFVRGSGADATSRTVAAGHYAVVSGSCKSGGQVRINRGSGAFEVIGSDQWEPYSGTSDYAFNSNSLIFLADEGDIIDGTGDFCAVVAEYPKLT